MHMKTVSIALLGAGMLALAACGGPAEDTNAAADNAVDTLAVPADELSPTDNLSEIPADSLGNEALPADANLAVDANLSADLNATANSQ